MSERAGGSTIVRRRTTALAELSVELEGLLTALANPESDAGSLRAAWARVREAETRVELDQPLPGDASPLERAKYGALAAEIQRRNAVASVLAAEQRARAAAAIGRSHKARALAGSRLRAATTGRSCDVRG